MNINKSREEALSKGLKTYQGKACKNCGGTEKITSNYGCVVCRKNNQAMNNKQRWQRVKASGENPDRRKRQAIAHKKYYDKNKEKLKEKLHEEKQLLGELYIKRLLSGIKSKCKKKGIVFNLSPSDIVIPEKCPVLGIPLKFNSGLGSNDDSPSIDRIIPSLGYTPSNIIVVSRRTNKIKNDSTSRELFLVYEFYKDKC